MAEQTRERARRPLDLTDPRTLTAVSRRVGLRRDTGLGQHFLIDRDVLDAIVDALDPEPDSEVLEIGCGLGTLTGALAARARRVVAIDVDPACVAGTEITQRANPNVTVLEADARTVDPAALGLTGGWLATGNLPYQLTGLVLMRLVETPEPPARAVVLVQREVAARTRRGAGGLEPRDRGDALACSSRAHSGRAAECIRPATGGAFVDHQDRAVPKNGPGDPGIDARACQAAVSVSPQDAAQRPVPCSRRRRRRRGGRTGRRRHRSGAPAGYASTR